mgnify:CR=1 FL=1
MFLRREFLRPRFARWGSSLATPRVCKRRLGRWSSPPASRPFRLSPVLLFRCTNGCSLKRSAEKLGRVPRSAHSAPLSELRVPSRGTNRVLLQMDGRVSFTSRTLSSKSSRVSPGKATMMSVPRVISGNRVLNALAICRYSLCVCLRFIALRMRSLPLCTGMWTNLYRCSSSKDSRSASK